MEDMSNTIITLEDIDQVTTEEITGNNITTKDNIIENLPKIEEANPNDMKSEVERVKSNSIFITK